MNTSGFTRGSYFCVTAGVGRDLRDIVLQSVGIRRTAAPEHDAIFHDEASGTDKSMENVGRYPRPATHASGVVAMETKAWCTP